MKLETLQIHKTDILVLNSTYAPLNIASWKRAAALLIKKKAVRISSRVIRLLEFIKIPVSRLALHKPSKKAIYKRDGHKCQYCGATRRLTIDHVIPKSLGGDDSWYNLVVACSTCNALKGNKPLEQTGFKLEKKPKPLSKTLFTISHSNNPEWEQYVYE